MMIIIIINDDSWSLMMIKDRTGNFMWLMVANDCIHATVVDFDQLVPRLDRRRRKTWKLKDPGSSDKRGEPEVLLDHWWLNKKNYIISK